MDERLYSCGTYHCITPDGCEKARKVELPTLTITANEFYHEPVLSSLRLLLQVVYVATRVMVAVLFKDYNHSLFVLQFNHKDN